MFVYINPLHDNMRIHILHTPLYIFFAYCKEKSLKNQKLPRSAIISVILMILMSYSAV